MDAGNSIINGKIVRREQGEIAFPHALGRLTESQYQNILSRARTNGSAKDYIRVHGTPYVIGENAERHGMVSKRSGAARYTKDYYGVLSGYCFSQTLWSRHYNTVRPHSALGFRPQVPAAILA